MKKKLFYFSLILIVMTFILLLSFKSVQSYWYDYIDPSILFDWLYSWSYSYDLTDLFFSWLEGYGFSYYGWDIIYWLMGYW